MCQPLEAMDTVDTLMVTAALVTSLGAGVRVDRGGSVAGGAQLEGRRRGGDFNASVEVTLGGWDFPPVGGWACGVDTWMLSGWEDRWVFGLDAWVVEWGRCMSGRHGGMDGWMDGW